MKTWCTTIYQATACSCMFLYTLLGLDMYQDYRQWKTTTCCLLLSMFCFYFFCIAVFVFSAAFCGSFVIFVVDLFLLWLVSAGGMPHCCCFAMACTQMASTPQRLIVVFCCYLLTMSDSPMLHRLMVATVFSNNFQVHCFSLAGCTGYCRLQVSFLLLGCIYVTFFSAAVFTGW